MIAGVGACFSAAVVLSTTMIQLCVPHEYIGIATSMAIAARSMGGFIETSLYTSVLQSKLIHYLPADVSIPLFKAQAPVQDIPLIIEALLLGNKALLQDIPQELLIVAEQGIKLAYAHSFRIVYLITIAFGVTGTFFVAFTRNVDNQMTRQVDVKLLEGAHIKDNNDTGAHIIERS
jgi:hypothetical protein